MPAGVLKDPVKQRAGQLGAEVRWHQPRVVRLDDLTGEQRRLVLALVNAARNAKAPADETASALEVDRVSDPSPTARS